MRENPIGSALAPLVSLTAVPQTASASSGTMVPLSAHDAHVAGSPHLPAPGWSGPGRPAASTPTTRTKAPTASRRPAAMTC
ncbi:hypothetical protein [Streptomyces sp. NPDC017958]|uniref:hypothetical protein n=1 Tax=Streptomyces sp. NPDC017958 TaxID=3365021 RepID=UPI0037B06686